MHGIRITRWRRKCTTKAASMTILLVKSWKAITCKMWNRKCQRIELSSHETQMTIRAKHTLCFFEESIVMPISETSMFNTRAGAKIFSYWTTTCSRKELAEVNISNVKCNTSEKRCEKMILQNLPAWLSVPVCDQTSHCGNHGRSFTVSGSLISIDWMYTIP